MFRMYLHDMLYLGPGYGGRSVEAENDMALLKAEFI